MVSGPISCLSPGKLKSVFFKDTRVTSFGQEPRNSRPQSAGEDSLSLHALPDSSTPTEDGFYCRRLNTHQDCKWRFNCRDGFRTRQPSSHETEILPRDHRGLDI
ncbi:hypothetical protein AVEN_186528-1 [Araneus ventricosus]|uniref:Uncharacterized protein n=1 Tax=Araneus ventricosus TaxID=182803 RepID=A0A4Y2RCH3_ARAVE|nr:hypothetical protein AVEN_186528-1 [Araneus ventricosus]